MNILKANNWSRYITILSISLILVHLGNAFDGIQAAENMSWLVYYSDKAPIKAFGKYDLLVLDSKYHPPLHPLADRGKILLGYLSLGEVKEMRPYFADVKAEGILLQENKNWKGSCFVDIRSRLWVSRVIEELIPDILRSGFDGLFLDTLDNAIYLEDEDPKKYKGMKKAAARLVRTIRLHYPYIKIMMNRAYEILPEVKQYINIALGESVFADYDFENKTYSLVPQNLYLKQVNILKASKERMPGLKVFTLDYWNPDDTKGIARIYREQRANGFEPYVATIELDRIIKEPR